MSYGEISPLQMKNYGGEVARHIRSFTEPPPQKRKCGFTSYPVHGVYNLVCSAIR